MDTTHPVAVGPVYDVRRVSELLHVVYNDAMLAAFGPPPAALPGFITFFNPGLSVLGLWTVLTFLGEQLFSSLPWFLTEPFAKVADDPAYRQLQMKALKNSFGKSFYHQQALVPPGAEFPTARVVLMAMVVHFLATGERLFPNHYVRCIDQTLVGYLVRVGVFGRDGVDVSSGRPDGSGGSLGVVLARKF